MSMKEFIEKYGVSGQVTVHNAALPVINITLMSDEAWQQAARENAVENYRKAFGCEPESVEKAVQWQRERCAALAAV